MFGFGVLADGLTEAEVAPGLGSVSSAVKSTVERLKDASRRRYGPRVTELVGQKPYPFLAYAEGSCRAPRGDEHTDNDVSKLHAFGAELTTYGPCAGPPCS